MNRGWKNGVPVHDEMPSEGEAFVKALMDKANEEAFQNITAKLILDGWHAIGRPITEFDTYCAENDIPYSRVAAATEEYGLSMKDEFFDGLESFSREDFRELFDKDIAKYEQLAAEIFDDYTLGMCLKEEDFSPALLESLKAWAETQKKIPETIRVTDIQYETDFDEICEYFLSTVRTDKEKAASLLYVSVDELQGMDDEQIADRLYNLLTDSDQFAGTVGLTIYDIFDLPREMEIPNTVLKGAEAMDCNELIVDYITEKTGFLPTNYYMDTETEILEEQELSHNLFCDSSEEIQEERV